MWANWWNKCTEECYYSYLITFEADGLRCKELKEKIRKENSRHLINIFRSKLSGGKKMTTIKSRAVSVIIMAQGLFVGKRQS